MTGTLFALDDDTAVTTPLPSILRKQSSQNLQPVTEGLGT